MKKIFALCILLVSFSTLAEQSLRKCVLLPIKDSVGGAIGFKVFQQVENYLKQSEWCYYRHNSEIINILSNYRRDLDSHLENSEVLKIISEKTRAGSLIKVNLISKAQGSEIEVKVIGSNGSDLLFKEKTAVNKTEPLVISQTIKNWLDVYEKSIPYDGRILGVLGPQFTTDIGKLYGIYNGYNIEVLRPTRKKRHPLLKEIVEWDTDKIAEAKIFHVTDVQSQGKVFKYFTKKRIQTNDWVVIKKLKQKDDNSVKYQPTNEYNFGKLGNFGLYLNAASTSATNTADGASTKKMSGLTFGVSLDGEVWATRNFWGGFELLRKFGSLSKKEGTLTNDSNSITSGYYKFKLGYKYLPLGFFYGPQVDAYFGYAKYDYGLDAQVADGFGDVSFSGLLLGARGSLPIMKDVRVHISLDFMLNPGYEEEVTIYGDADSTNNYSIEFGGSYQYSPTMKILGGLSFISNKAEFKAPVRSLSMKDTNLKGGVVFNF